MKVGQAYVGEDGQWYYYTQRDLDKAKAYEQGSTDAYYGKIKLGPNKVLDNYDPEETRWYWKGYGDAIFGEKDYD